MVLDMVLDTLVYHVCEKTGTIHIPDVAAVYAQILAANDGKYPNVLLLPQYSEVWVDELAWIAANFGGVGGIPIMLQVFGSSYGDTAQQLSTDDILAAMAVANVQWLRISEVVSWYEAHEQTFPVEYVTAILQFAEDHDLKVMWNEWAIVFDEIKTYIVGFEDIVTVTFATNSGAFEPADGFAYMKTLGLTHWGASVQSWYWETRHRSETGGGPIVEEASRDMPVSWIVAHAVEAKEAGAELIQFEPYWYFFEDLTGVARVSLQRMHYFLNGQMAGMEASALILQTLQAEWLYGPAKADISWLEGRVSTVAGWDIQPSTHDFSKLTKKYAVSCYNVGCSSPSGALWLKNEVVAVDILVKVLGTTLDKASLIRECMRVEVERILYLYSKVGPLWTLGLGPTGLHQHRRIPGLSDVVVSQMGNQTDDSNLARVTVQVKCRVFPKKSWV